MRIVLIPGAPGSGGGAAAADLAQGLVAAGRSVAVVGHWGGGLAGALGVQPGVWGVTDLVRGWCTAHQALQPSPAGARLAALLEQDPAGLALSDEEAATCLTRLEQVADCVLVCLPGGSVEAAAGWVQAADLSLLAGKGDPPAIRQALAVLEAWQQRGLPRPLLLARNGGPEGMNPVQAAELLELELAAGLPSESASPPEREAALAPLVRRIVAGDLSPLAKRRSLATRLVTALHADRGEPAARRLAPESGGDTVAGPAPAEPAPPAVLPEMGGAAAPESAPMEPVPPAPEPAQTRPAPPAGAAPGCAAAHERSTAHESATAREHADAAAQDGAPDPSAAEDRDRGGDAPGPLVMLSELDAQREALTAEVRELEQLLSGARSRLTRVHAEMAGLLRRWLRQLGPVDPAD